MAENLDDEHIDALITADLVALNEDTFERVESEESRITLIANNFDTFASNTSGYEVNDTVLLHVAMRIHDEDAFDISKLISDEIVLSNSRLIQKLAAAIPTKPLGELSTSIAVEVLKKVHPRDVRIAELTEMIPEWSWDSICAILISLAGDYRLITMKGKSPRIPKTPANYRLVEALKQGGFISSYSETWDKKIRINTFKKERW